MDGSDYQRLAHRTQCPQDVVLERISSGELPTENRIAILHSAIGIATEAGEFLTDIEHWLWYGQKMDRVNMLAEIGDALWYIAEACNALGVSLESVMEANIAKLRQRYPERYTDLQAAEQNRDRSAEREVLEQNGVGWAEPPDETGKDYRRGSVLDGERLHHDYDRLCKACGLVPIHKTNTTGVCPDCYGGWKYA